MKLDQNYCLYSPTDYAEALPRSQFMDFQIKPLWSPIPRISGFAFTVKLAPSDNLMLHAAIYQAPPGSIIVVEAGDTDFAVAGGNGVLRSEHRCEGCSGAGIQRVLWPGNTGSAPKGGIRGGARAAQASSRQVAHHAECRSGAMRCQRDQRSLRRGHRFVHGDAGRRGSQGRWAVNRSGRASGASSGWTPSGHGADVDRGNLFSAQPRRTLSA